MELASRASARATDDGPLLAGPEHDPVFQNLALLRAPGRLQQQIERAWSQSALRSAQPAPAIVCARITQIHYKPFGRARVVVEAVLGCKAAELEQTQFLFINIYRSAERAREKYAQAAGAQALPSYGPAVALLEDFQAVVWSLPNGPKLDAIQYFLGAAKFRQFLAEHRRDLGFDVSCEVSPELIRYVPRKRALFRYAPGPTAYIKLYGPGEDKTAAANLALMTKAASEHLNFEPPRLLLHDAPRRAVVMSEVPGAQLTSGCVNIVRALPAVAQALAGLHASGIKPSTAWSPESEMAALSLAMIDVTSALPALAPSINTLLAWIAALRRDLVFSETTPIHANLFGDQILIASNAVSIVDWDDLAAGDPLYDVGRLAAHLIYLSLCRNTDPASALRHLHILFGAYAKAVARPLDRQRLRWHIAIALLMRAKISALRALPAGWVAHIDETVKATARIMEDESEWLL